MRKIHRLVAYICFALACVCVRIWGISIANIRYGTWCPVVMLDLSILFLVIGIELYVKIKSRLTYVLTGIFCLGMFAESCYYMKATRQYIEKNMLAQKAFLLIRIFLIVGIIYAVWKIWIEMRKRLNQKRNLLSLKEKGWISLFGAIYSWNAFLRMELEGGLTVDWIIITLCLVGCFIYCYSDLQIRRSSLIMTIGILASIIVMGILIPLIDGCGTILAMIVPIFALCWYICKYRKIKKEQVIVSKTFKTMALCASVFLGSICLIGFICLKDAYGFRFYLLIASIAFFYSVVLIVGNVFSRIIYIAIIWCCILEVLILNLNGNIYWWPAFEVRWLLIMGLTGLGGYIVASGLRSYKEV